MKFEIGRALRVGLLVGSFSVHAHAEPEFPGAIQDAANIPCTPTCLLCHTAIPGSASNLNMHFAQTVIANGVEPGNPESLNAVVAKLRANMVDTDGDGQLDVDELAAGTDPNSADPRAELCGPTYGCGAHVAPSAPARRAAILWPLMFALGLAGLVMLRRRAN
ncbi:MAG TPA: thrombospondin type 3 repeat-containing protein [Polyangiaceae bacterium]|nr:thrombospondin type 3 repeat-containing protein [Polyangiaceae bacterium]